MEYVIIKQVHVPELLHLGLHLVEHLGVVEVVVLLLVQHYFVSCIEHTLNVVLETLELASCLYCRVNCDSLPRVLLCRCNKLQGVDTASRIIVSLFSELPDDLIFYTNVFLLANMSEASDQLVWA